MSTQTQHSLEAAERSGDEVRLAEELRKAKPDVAPTVIGILERARSPRVRNAAALALADMRAANARDSLTDALRRAETRGHRGTILYALDELGAKLPLSLLADIIVEDPYEAREEALGFLASGRVDRDANPRQVKRTLRAALRGADEERSHAIGEALGYLSTTRTMDKRPYAFVLMPFAEKHNGTFTAIQNAAKAAGVRAERVKDRYYFREGMIERIWSQIEGADLIISDLTVQNANVYYETGYALANGKLSILLTRNSTKIPFDLKNRRYVIYSSLEDLECQLERELVAAKGETDLSFDRNDSQCVARVSEYVIEQRVVDTTEAISIRAKFQVNSEMSPRNVVPRLLKIERRISDDSWEEARLVAPILLTWADNDTNEADFDQKKIQYVNVLHTNKHTNQLTIWRVDLLPSVANFFQEHTKYRLTVSVLEKQLQIEVDWEGQWDTVLPTPVT